MDTNQIALVARRSIEGHTQREIAAEVGVSNVTVHRTQHKPDIKAKVEAGINKLINRGLNPAINTLCRAAALGNTKSISQPDNRDLLKLSIDASNKILSHAVGAGPQTIINQLIYSQGTHASVDSFSMDMVNRALGIANQEDVIDVLPVDNPVDK